MGEWVFPTAVIILPKRPLNRISIMKQRLRHFTQAKENVMTNTEAYLSANS
jgi:hypothetical protein